jgi:hypothetical protein
VQVRQLEASVSHPSNVIHRSGDINSKVEQSVTGSVIFGAAKNVR